MTIWGLNFLKGKHIFSKQRHLYAICGQIDGLLAASPVYLNGLRVGMVEDVYFYPGDTARRIVVRMILDNEISIPRNSVARIASSDLIGGRTIQIIPIASDKNVESGDTLTSETQLSIAQEVNKQVAPIKAKAESMLASLDSVLAVIQYVFNKETRDNLAKSFESISRAIITLEHTTTTFDTIVSAQQSRLSNIFSNVESISLNLKNNNQKITEIINNFEAISDSIAKVSFAKTIRNADKVLTETSQIMEKINSGKGSLGMLINNDSLYTYLKYTAADVDLLVKDLKANPKRYVHFSLIGGGGGAPKTQKKVETPKQ